MTNEKVISLAERVKSRDNYDVYAQAIQRNSDMSGIDYNKLYSGSFEERKAEKYKQKKLRLQQRLEILYLEG